MMASGACPSASGAKSSGLRPGWTSLPADEPFVAFDQPGEHGVRVCVPRLGCAAADAAVGRPEPCSGDRRSPESFDELATGRVIGYSARWWPLVALIEHRQVTGPVQAELEFFHRGSHGCTRS